MFRFVRFPQKSGADLGIVELKSSGWLAGYIEESGEVCRLCFFFLFVCLFVCFCFSSYAFPTAALQPSNRHQYGKPFFFFLPVHKKETKKKKKNRRPSLFAELFDQARLVGQHM